MTKASRRDREEISPLKRCSPYRGGAFFATKMYKKYDSLFHLEYFLRDFSTMIRVLSSILGLLNLEYSFVCNYKKTGRPIIVSESNTVCSQLFISTFISNQLFSEVVFDRNLFCLVYIVCLEA